MEGKAISPYRKLKVALPLAIPSTFLFFFRRDFTPDTSVISFGILQYFGTAIVTMWRLAEVSPTFKVLKNNYRTTKTVIV